MRNNEDRDRYEQYGQSQTIEVYSQIADQWNVDITDFQVPEDPYCSYDITASIKGEIRYIENKTRSDKYHWHYFKDKGYLLATAKNDGQNTLFNCWWPNDNIVMITNDRQLEDLTPRKTWVEHIVNCDPDSPSGYVLNYIVPYNRWWVYQIEPIKLLSKPTKQ